MIIYNIVTVPIFRLNKSHNILHIRCNQLCIQQLIFLVYYTILNIVYEIFVDISYNHTITLALIKQLFFIIVKGVNLVHLLSLTTLFVSLWCCFLFTCL